MDRSGWHFIPETARVARIRRAPLLAMLIFCVAAGDASADGGILELHTRRPPPGDILPWEGESEGRLLMTEAVMRLDRETIEDVFIYAGEGPSAIRFVVSQSKPRRLFCDLNGDGECQPDEVYMTSSGGGQDFFRDVRVPVRVRDATQTIVADFQHTSFWKIHTLSVSRIMNLFEGKLTVAGTQYPARLEFRSLFPQDGVVNETITLDVNSDGSFDPVYDASFSSEGVAYLNGSLWSVGTDYHSATAEVSLEPYAGPAGHLEVQGDGIEQVLLQREYREPVDATPEPRYQLSLPPRADRIYPLPPGDYRVSGVWLRNLEKPDPLYRLSALPFDQARQARVIAGGTGSIVLGGPLYEAVKARRKPIFRSVHLDHQGWTNEAGFEFEEQQPRRLEALTPRTPPEYEILDSRGNRVAAGSFEYG